MVQGHVKYILQPIVHDSSYLQSIVTYWHVHDQTSHLLLVYMESLSLYYYLMRYHLHLKKHEMVDDEKKKKKDS